MDTRLHPAMTVSNIKNMIPITLDSESSQYTTWTTLFEVHCRAYQVFEHLQPRTQPAAPARPASDADAVKAATTAADAEALWSRLDAIVLQWVYGTISPTLLDIILIPGQTAYEAWQAIADHFNDNKLSRQILLQQQFSNLHLDAFPNMAAYCQQVKHLADQLNSVGAPVDNQRLVTQLLAGLTEAYESISTVLQNRDPLPTFSECRSRLTMAESTKKSLSARAASASATALAATVTDAAAASSRVRNQNRGKNRPPNRTRGGSRGGRTFGNTPQHPYIVFPNSWAANQWSSLMQNSAANTSAQHATPPCPYPTAPRNNSAGILGAAPDQAYTATLSPTDIQQALYALSLQQQDPQDVMDTGASGHMKIPQGSQDQGTPPQMQ